MICYLNGGYLPRASATIPVEDRGFIFGDGVYEVWRVLNGRLFEPERHLSRLAHGLSELRIDSPEIMDLTQLNAVARRLLDESDLLAGEATLYVEITRGVASRTHQFPAAGTTPTVFAMVNRFVPPADLRARGTNAITMPDVRWLRCDLKTIQLLPNVMAKQTAADRGATEAIFVRDGIVTEGSHTNVMAVFDGVIRTHPLGNFVLAGITRAVVLELAPSLGLRVDETAIREADIMNADELFLVGTTTDVMPVVRVNDRPIGTGSPGEVTMRAYRAFRDYMYERCGIAADRALASA